ncbi:CAP domain-containing protein [uncultured Sulfitobacter sp.]|uniref:CAP domain-containing protein n=1 Tax=uncultured Sulfitobacter sp. TaxID=191468 RepID=UPI00260AD57D|nr:CAP domain-containing protein [uncultured Sulfitobacter sp.]
MRIALTLVTGLALAACATTSPAPVAQQFTQTSGSPAALVNAIRKQAGVSGVKRSRVLDAAAKAHANDMASNNFFGHTGSNGSSVAKRVKAAGYTWCTVSENVGKGYRSSPRAIEAWRVSRGHYRNMVNRKAREFGFARSGDYSVMVLAARKC